MLQPIAAVAPLFLSRSRPDMRIASWNVNSMKARIEHVLSFLGTDMCDVLLAQELKLTDENFPTDSFTKNGWHVETHGQKTYNGVAIISRYLSLRM